MGVLNFKDIPRKMTDEVRRTAARIEKEYDLRCTVIFNPLRLEIGGTFLTLSLVVYPPENVGSDDPSFQARLKRCFEEQNSLPLLVKRRWAWHFTIGSTDPIKWFERFRDKPDRFPTADGAIGADLIMPVIWGETLVSQMRAKAEDFFGRGIFELWQEKITPRMEQRAYSAEREKLLNEYELEELKSFLFGIEKLCLEKPFKCIVALDGSGRPVGKALRWFLDDSVRIFHLSPHWLRSVDFNDSEVMKKAERILRAEFPRLYSIWRSNPSSILFVDDQIARGVTRECLIKFTKHLSGEETIRFYAMSMYNGPNTVSWWHKRDVQGIQTRDTFSFLARKTRTKKSAEFYRKLKGCVLEWQET
jgi:hypothetical protein